MQQPIDKREHTYFRALVDTTGCFSCLMSASNAKRLKEKPPLRLFFYGNIWVEIRKPR